MLVPMAKVRILGHKGCLDQTLATLRGLGVVQIERAAGEEPPLPAMALDAGRLRQREQDRALLTRLQTLLAALPAPGAESAPSPVPDLAALAQELDAVEPQIRRLVQQRDALEAERLSLPRYRAVLESLLPLAAELPDLVGYETVALLIERRARHVIDLLDDLLTELTQRRHVVIAAPLDRDTYGALVVFPRAVATEVHALLGRQEVTRVQLPPTLAGKPLRQAIAECERRMNEIPGELTELSHRLAALADAHRARWRAAVDLLAARIEQTEIIEHLSETQFAFVLVGWTPARAVPELTRVLAEQVGPSVVVEEFPLTERERHRAPVLLENAPPVRPFECLVRLLALPQPGALDPSALMALVMPLFMGMMIGDVAYGLLIVAITGTIARRARAGSVWRDLALILCGGGLWAILFGFLYGEFLGTLGPAIGLHPLWRAREDAATLVSLFVLAIAIGATHVILGLLLGIGQAWRKRAFAQRQAWQEIEERLGRLIGLIALFVLVAVAARQLPQALLTPAAAALLVGLVILARASWPLGALMAPVEMLGVVGNVLSYLRLAAIGLSSVYLALVGNELAGLVGNLWLGIVIATLFHALNLALAAFSPTIHALRLHYVEFFTKFYEEGGVPFRPFGQKS